MNPFNVFDPDLPADQLPHDFLHGERLADGIERVQQRVFQILDVLQHLGGGGGNLFIFR